MTARNPERVAATDTPQAIRRLLAAYRATCYTVQLADGEARLHVGAAPPAALMQLLQPDHPWVLISACNPHSRPRSARSNALRMRALTRALAAVDPRRVFDAAGYAPDRRWAEPGLLVIGLDPANTDALARRFDQNALLAGHGVAPARLRLYRADWAAALGRVDIADCEWAEWAVESARA